MKHLSFIIAILAFALLSVPALGQGFVKVEIHSPVSEDGKMRAPSNSGLAPELLCYYYPLGHSLHVLLGKSEQARITVFHVDEETVVVDMDNNLNYYDIPLQSPGKYQVFIRLSSGLSYVGEFFADFDEYKDCKIDEYRIN